MNNIEVYALERDSALGDLKYSRFVDKLISHNYGGDELATFIEQVCNEHRIDIIFGLSINTIDFLISHKSQLSKSARIQLLPEREVFDLTSDKGRLANFLENHGINSPVTWPAVNHEQNLHRMTFPVLLKPRKGEGGMGIFKCTNEEELHLKLKDIAAGDYIIQGYIHGYDIDCSVLAKNGIILFHTIQRGIEESKYNEFSPCSAIEFVNADALYLLVAKFIKEVKFTGVGHLDLRYNAATGEYVIIEINSRYWDTVVGSFLTAGVNFPYLHAMASLDVSIAPRAFKTGVYMTAKTYFLYKLNKLKLPVKDEMVRFNQSGIRVRLYDPLYYLLVFLREKIKKLRRPQLLFFCSTLNIGLFFDLVPFQ